MPDPTNASRPVAKLASNNKSAPQRKPANVEWTRPVRPPLKSGMLQNRRLDLNKSPQRATNKRP